MVSNHLIMTQMDNIHSQHFKRQNRPKQKQFSRRLDFINKDIHFCRVLIVTINLQLKINILGSP